MPRISQDPQKQKQGDASWPRLANFRLERNGVHGASAPEGFHFARATSTGGAKAASIICISLVGALSPRES